MNSMLKNGDEQAVVVEFKAWFWGLFVRMYGPSLGWIQEDAERYEARFFSERRRNVFDSKPSIPMEGQPEASSSEELDDADSVTAYQLSLLEDEACRLERAEPLERRPLQETLQASRVIAQLHREWENNR
jgi:hypothetical protein